MDSSVPTPEEYNMPEGGTTPSENLPTPDNSRPMATPPADRSSRWPGAEKHAADRSIAAAADPPAWQWAKR